jgi:hypothetical protein
MTVALGLEKLKDTVIGVLFLELKGCFDFTMDELDGNVVRIVVSVVMSKNFEGAIRAVLLDIPTRRFPVNQKRFGGGAYGTNQIPTSCIAAKTP